MVRSHKNCTTGFKGNLQCDGYQGYGMLPETVSRSGCWAHVRRKFIETGPTPRRVKCKAKQALEMINELFKIEKALKNTSLQERFAVRQAKSQPIVEHFFDWLNITNVVEKSALRKAVHYALGQQKLLTSFLNDAAISLTNNTAERHIKTAVIGRKFCRLAPVKMAHKQTHCF